MAVSKTETIGFANQFNPFLTDNKASLQEKGLDVSAWITPSLWIILAFALKVYIYF